MSFYGNISNAGKTQMSFDRVYPKRKIMEENHNHIKPAHVKLTIHPVIPTKGLSKDELAALPDQVYHTIASALPKED